MNSTLSKKHHGSKDQNAQKRCSGAIPDEHTSPDITIYGLNLPITNDELHGINSSVMTLSILLPITANSIFYKTVLRE